MSHEPTIVLVHGAFADASSWSGVVERLLQGGHHVVAPANPLRGVRADSAYIASYVNQIDGPTILVGHSYGGAVISNAASSAKNVLGLVFVAAYAPENGETLGGAGASSKDSVLNSALVQRLYPTGKDGETGPEFIVDPAKFHDAFAADVPEKQSAVMAATQRPIAAGAFSEASGPPAWKTIASWAVVAVGDQAAGTDVIRSMAKRARAKTVEIKGSHVIMVSQPQAVTDVILEALQAVAKPVAGAGVRNKS
jgi:pimeloyl-ACP methyl ester carboxylesterase